MVDIKSLNTRRGRIKAQVTVIETFITTINIHTSLPQLEVRLEKLDSLQTDFNNTIAAYDTLTDDPAYVSQDDEIQQFDERYFAAATVLREHIQRLQRGEANVLQANSSRADESIQNIMAQQSEILDRLTTRDTSQETRLPAIEIPKFSGDYTKWASFSEMFISSVHRRTNLTKSQKLSYLKGFLTGDASSLIESFIISDQNYAEAWNKLSLRYNRRGEMIKEYIKRYVNQPSLNTASSSGLRVLCDEFDYVIRGLKSMGHDAESRDHWLIFIAVSKLDADTQRQWAYEMANVELPTFENFLQFLEKQWSALSFRETTTNTSTPVARRNGPMRGMVTIAGTCPLCQLDHKLFQCTQFKGMTITERKAFVIQRSLCFNCFSDSHIVSKCNHSVSCHYCQHRHHSMIHGGAITNQRAIAYDTNRGLYHKVNSNRTQEHYRAPKTHLGSINFATDMEERGFTYTHQNPFIYNDNSYSSINTPLQDNVNQSFYPSQPMNYATINQPSRSPSQPFGASTSTNSFNQAFGSNSHYQSEVPSTSSQFHGQSFGPNTSSQFHGQSFGLNTSLPQADQSHNQQSHNQQAHNTAINKLPSLLDATINTGGKLNRSSSINMHDNNEGHMKSHVGLNSSSKQNVPLSLLPTAMVFVRNSFGQQVSCRLMLDSGSQASLMTESCAQRLGLKRRKATVSVQGLGSVGAGVTRGIVSCQLTSIYDEKQYINIDAFILTNVTSQLPALTVPENEWSSLGHLKLADPTFHKPGRIDLLIGADAFFSVLLDGRLIGQSLMAQSTIFGWIIAGKLQGEVAHSNISCCHIITQNSSDNTMNLSEVDTTLKRFWELEEVKDEPILSENEIKCEEHFKQTHQRDKGGRFVVRLPFKSVTPSFGNTFGQACNRFLSLERRLDRNLSLKESYKKFIHEYISLGHMQEISTPNIMSNCFYLPHHAVIKASSSTTKLRVVFDASCKSDTGVSLNEQMLVGPNVQSSLFDIIIRFRLYKVVVTADIEKMYRQVIVHPDDTNYQRIIWRDDKDSPLQHFRLTTVTYGTASAPYLATKVLQQISIESKSTHPLTSEVIGRDFYVDDLMTGADTEDEVISLKDDLVRVLSDAGFRLRKWTSNAVTVINSIDLEDQELTAIDIDDNSTSVKVLGLRWLPCSDRFTFKVTNLENTPATKRNILAEASRIYDPMGWLAPSIVLVKILFQQLWLKEVGWDDVLPVEQQKTWHTLKTNFHYFEQIKIRRWLQTSIQSEEEVELHGFSDASERAYSAVIYCRNILPDGTITVSLLVAKTKVAPIKRVSLARLELCGAVLLTKLMKSVVSALHVIKNLKYYGWTDSSIVLSWISAHPSKWKAFVGNRVSEIIDFWPRRLWGHVQSSDNPSDCASRGVEPEKLLSHKLWWNGPVWLTLDRSKWPQQRFGLVESINDLEIAGNNECVKVNTLLVDDNIFIKLSLKHSSWFKLIRVVAYMRRFITNMRQKTNRKSTTYLLVTELNQATQFLIHLYQLQSFSDEIKQLSTHKPISTKSRLLSLCPILDKDNILRVRGRLENSNLPYDVKHPIILPECHLSVILVDAFHTLYLHAGPTLLSNILRQRFWIIGGRQLIRARFHKCIICFRQRCKPQHQRMGDLPAVRIQKVQRPFVNVGVDFAGPIIIRSMVKRSRVNMKAYIAIFVCLSTKAMHIETVSSLSTTAFISCLKRFVARRGFPSTIHSDNGTNFIGTSRELSEVYKHLAEHGQEIAGYLAKHEVQWKFIPPSAPNFGGIWEAGVKSVKGHLRKLTGDTKFTFEELSTFLSQIEAILNSRPICPMSIDVTDLNVLTPGHFLIGQPLISVPEHDVTDIPLNRLSRFQYIQRLVQEFWIKWKRDYLNHLQSRSKWTTLTDNIKEGDMVVLHRDDIPPMQWDLGRISKCYSGPDGLIRVVDVTTAHSTYKRSISKISRLPSLDCF